MDAKQVLTLKEARLLVSAAIARGIDPETIAERYKLKNGSLIIDQNISKRNGMVRRESVSVKTESAANKAQSKAKTWQGKANIGGKAGFLKISANGLIFNGKPVDTSGFVAVKAAKEAFEVAERVGFSLGSKQPLTPTPTPTVKTGKGKGKGKTVTA